jgi:tetratricopeptide (TPR) repeat protein
LQRKDLQNAQAAFARAVKYSPGMVDAWFGLGLAQRDQGHAKEAIEALTQATALNGNYAEAWLYLGLTYEETGDRGRAAEAFTHAYDTSGDEAVRRQAEEGLNRVR